MKIKDVPKRYKGWKIKIVKSKTFVATSRNHVIPINYWYVIQKNVDINDIEAIFEHEIEEDLEFRKRHKPLAIAHSLATKKERAFLIKKNENFSEHQKEVFKIYRTKATLDAPYFDLKV